MFKSLIPQAYAQCDPTSGSVNLGDCYYLNQQGDLVSQVYDRPAVLVNLFIRNGFVIAGVVIFGMMLYAGFKYIEETDKGKQQARDIMTNSLIGFIILFAAYWIVRIVEIIIGMDLGI